MDSLKKPLVSIIIPIYNVEKYLRECIDSVLKQTYNNLQIILVDDGSPDNCGSICDEYAEKDDRITVIHKENGGLSSARNEGIKIARGQYIGFVDSDDFIDENMYSNLMHNININNADIAICGRVYVYGDKNVIRCKKNIYLKMNSEEAINKMNTFGYYDVASWDKIYKRELFEGIEFPIGKLSEDWFTTYKLLDKAETIIYDSTPMYYYRQREKSITHSRKVNYNPIYASKEVLGLVEKKYPDSIIYAITAYVYANIGVYDNLILYDKENNDEIKKVLINIKENYDLVIKNKELSNKRILQLKLLKLSPMIYNCVFKIFDLLRR